MESRDVTKPESMRKVVSAKRVTLKQGRKPAVTAVIKVIKEDFEEALNQHAVWSLYPQNVPRVYGYGLVASASVHSLLDLPDSVPKEKAAVAVMVMEYIPHSLVNDLSLLEVSDVALLVRELRHTQVALFEKRQRLQNDPFPRNVLLRVNPETNRVISFVLADYGKTKGMASKSSMSDGLYVWLGVLLKKLSELAERWIRARPGNASLSNGPLLSDLESKGKTTGGVYKEILALSTSNDTDDEGESEDLSRPFTELPCSICNQNATGFCSTCDDWLSVYCSAECLSKGHLTDACLATQEMNVKLVYI